MEQQKRFRWVLVLPLAFWSVLAESSPSLDQSLGINNNNPFIRIYGIPRMASAEITPNNRNELNLTLDVISSFTDAEKNGEFIAIDGETYRATLRWARGFSDGWEAGVEIPVWSNSGGFLDEFIIEWHDLFGLPGLGRDKVANNQLNYRYDRNGRTLVQVTASETGLGDVVVFAGTRLDIGNDASKLGAVARGQIKLPTGDTDNLFGSGGVDAAIWGQAYRRWRKRWSLYGGLGVSYLGGGDVLPELQRNWVAFGNFGGAWLPHPRVSLKLQLDAQTSIYKSTALKQLGSEAVQTTIGGSIQLAENWVLDLGVTEDEVIFDVSPDVSFHIRLRWQEQAKH